MLSLPQPQTHRQLRLQLQLSKHPPWEPLVIRTIQLHPLLPPGLRRLPQQRLRQRQLVLRQMTQRLLRRPQRRLQLLPPPQITMWLLVALLLKACKRKLLR